MFPRRDQARSHTNNFQNEESRTQTLQGSKSKATEYRPSQPKTPLAKTWFRDKVRVETLRRAIPRLSARAQPRDSVALESQLSTPSQGAFTSQQTASTLCARGAARGHLYPRLRTWQGAGRKRSASPQRPLTSRRNLRVRTAGPRTGARQSRGRPRLKVPIPWSRPFEGLWTNRSPGTQAGAEPARVPQKCARAELNRWTVNGSAPVVRGDPGLIPWLQSGSQLSWPPHSRLSRRGSEGRSVREAGVTGGDGPSDAPVIVMAISFQQQLHAFY